MHDTMTSIRSIWCMPKHTEYHTPHKSILGSLLKLGHTWPILILAHKMAKWRKKTWLPNMRNVLNVDHEHKLMHGNIRDTSTLMSHH